MKRTLYLLGTRINEEEVIVSSIYRKRKLLKEKGIRYLISTFQVF